MQSSFCACSERARTNFMHVVAALKLHYGLRERFLVN